MSEKTVSIIAIEPINEDRIYQIGEVLLVTPERAKRLVDELKIAKREKVMFAKAQDTAPVDKMVKKGTTKKKSVHTKKKRGGRR